MIFFFLETIALLQGNDLGNFSYTKTHAYLVSVLVHVYMDVCVQVCL